MSGENSIESLREQHRSLDAELEEESHRPAPDSARITELKREKLRIKDQIAAMEAAAKS